MMGYSELLDKANQSDDVIQRMIYVTAFAISQYSHNMRTTKPLNSLMGETFEFTKKDKFRFVGEQIGTRPPLSVCYADNEHWSFHQDFSLKTKFTGNSLECNPAGCHHLRLRSSGEYFTWSYGQTVVHNVLIGPLWNDHQGEFEITNHMNGFTAKVEFLKGAWLVRCFQIKAMIRDANGKELACLDGKWNERLTCTGDEPEGTVIWNHTDPYVSDATNQFKLTRFAQELNRIDEFLKSTLPSTDSRLRKDRLAFEHQELKKAATEKRNLEMKQRTWRKFCQQNNRETKPMYFEKAVSPGGVSYWKSKGNYWAERTKRIKALTTQKPCK